MCYVVNVKQLEDQLQTGLHKIHQTLPVMATTHLPYTTTIVPMEPTATTILTQVGNALATATKKTIATITALTPSTTAVSAGGPLASTMLTISRCLP